MALIDMLLIILSVYVGTSKMEAEDKTRYFVTIGVVIGVLLIISILKGGK